MVYKMFFSRTAAPNGRIFSTEHPWEQEIKVVKIPGVKSGNALRGQIFI